MERSEIAEIICEALYTGHVAASLASVVDDQARWALVSGSSQQQTLSDSSPSAKYFQGFVGLRGIANFCRDALQIASGDLTGCVIRGDCLFAFGTLRLQAAPNKKPMHRRACQREIQSERACARRVSCNHPGGKNWRRCYMSRAVFAWQRRARRRGS